ncbi:class I SAM-dependent methyltransferase [Candidatus Gottesmanbacteria bacterium]|nr:class I SAM-dependent methyltransferase [Candidatus Gottesmanbacteria bacterium]
MRDYENLIKEEMEEWKEIEGKMLKKGIPWWVDLRRAKLKGKDLFWRNDPKKETIVRGEEKEKLIKLATEKKGKVVDLGCGSGWLSLELARNGMKVVGIDVSPDRIKIAKKFLKENPFKKNFGKVEYLVDDLNKIDFPENSFDAVVVWDTLHHFPNLDEILIKVKRWLKPQGKFVVYDHIGNKLLKFGSQILELFWSKEKGSKVIPYEDILGKKIISLIKKRFEVKSTYTRLSFPVSILLYLLLSKDFLMPLLPVIIKIDRFLCNSRFFLGEYVFIDACNKKP